VTDHLDAHPSPLLVYRWADTDAELTRRAGASAAGGGPPGMVSLEFVNPATGASVLPTLSCGMHRIAVGGSSPAVRRTGNTVFVIHRGTGHSVVEGTRFDWEAGDMLVVPSWAAAEHHADAGADADLFSLGDTPVLRALGVYRETQLDGPQEVRGVFTAATPS
jgi:gentisate 1,2-dioxygenase